MTKQQRLDEITKQIAATKGHFSEYGLNPVPGEGNPDARILFIGEGPGFLEDQMGRPFVGQSGKLLRKTLAANGWLESEVFITNIVKFRPPENRDPHPAEIEFFKPFLDEQIKIIEPEVIVTLGRFSMHKFLGEGVSISRIHGLAQKIEWNTRQIVIFPMYHPAAALRQGSVMRDFEEDFKKLTMLVWGKSEQFSTNPVKMDEEKELSEQLELI